jgi:hypothetical protein
MRTMALPHHVARARADAPRSRAPGVRNRRARFAAPTRARADERPTKASDALAEKFTTGGGGADGFCDYDDIKDAIKECEGLSGAKLEACYAQYGCNLDTVTEHYAKAAGIDARAKET